LGSSTNTNTDFPTHFAPTPVSRFPTADQISFSRAPLQSSTSPDERASSKPPPQIQPHTYTTAKMRATRVLLKHTPMIKFIGRRSVPKRTPTHPIQTNLPIPAQKLTLHRNRPHPPSAPRVPLRVSPRVLRLLPPESQPARPHDAQQQLWIFASSFSLPSAGRNWRQHCKTIGKRAAEGRRVLGPQ
jgi:hypothetical protein